MTAAPTPPEPTLTQRLDALEARVGELERGAVKHAFSGFPAGFDYARTPSVAATTLPPASAAPEDRASAAPRMREREAALKDYVVNSVAYDLDVSTRLAFRAGWHARDRAEAGPSAEVRKILSELAEFELGNDADIDAGWVRGTARRALRLLDGGGK